MPRRVRQLGVWVGPDQIAILEQRRPYEITCRYTDLALERWSANSPVISCSLPVTDLRADAVPFCRGLLPEGAALEAAAKQAEVTVIDVFALLKRYGRDIAGALVISEEEPEPRDAVALPYTAEQLNEEVSELPQRPLALHDDSELSLAGLQNKILLVRLPEGRWARPVHGYPSTHILKVDDPRNPGLVSAEEGCLALARTVGLTNITPDLEEIGGERCLIVSRYDRLDSADGEAPGRVHQEDILQALGIDANRNQARVKYERHGGPTFTQIAALLNKTAAYPPEQLNRLVRIMTFNLLIGNADAHGKNISLLHDPLGTTRLAPLYDTVPTVLWPKLHATSAMRVNGKEDLNSIVIEDIAAEAGRWRYSSNVAEREARDLIEMVLEAAKTGTAPSNIRKLVRSRAKLLLGR